MKSEGHVVRTWYKGYFGLYDGPDRKSYDDTLFVSQFATLLNTSEHTIYFEIEPILKKIRERFLDRKSAKLTESVLDDLEHNEITQDDIVRAKQKALYYDEMYLFNVVPGNTEIISPLELIGDLADAMGIDIYIESYDDGDFDDVEYVDHSEDDSFQTDSQLCVYINQPTSDYDKAKFLIMLMEIISHEYEVGTDVRLYRRNSRDIFKMDTWQGGTMMQLINMCSLRIRDIKEGCDVQSLMSYGSTIAVYQDVCNLLCFYTDPKMNCVERAIRNLMKRPMYMNESRLNESILDNVERTSTDISDVISDNEHSDFRYMLVIPGDSKGGFDYKDKDIAIVRTEQAIKSLGVNCKVECYLKNEYDSLDLDMKSNLNWAANIVCIKYNYPNNLLEQIKFVYRMLYAYYLNFRSHTVVYMFKYQNGKYVYAERNTVIEPIIKLYVYLKDSCRFGDIDSYVLISSVTAISSLLPIETTDDNLSRVLNIVRIIIKNKRKRWII